MAEGKLKAKVTQMLDGLASIMTGGGTTVDKRMHNIWLANAMVKDQIEAAYRGSWLMRKIIDLPPYDMTRAWRDWQASPTQIEDLENEERRLHVRERIRQGLTLGRLGGGVIVMGFDDDPVNELDVESVKLGDLQYLYPASRWDVKLGDPITDPTSEQFGEPSSYELRIKGKDIIVHHSRVLVFKGLFSGNLSTLGRSEFWGDSVVTAVNEPVENATTVQNEFATLITEAKVDVYKVPDLLAKAGNVEFEKRLLRRFELSNIGKSNHRALILDASEEWEQRELTLTSMAELATTYMAIVAGAADIPATRLLGKSPDGMNATGRSDQSNYDQMIRTKQDNELRPNMDTLDAALIPSALGSRPEEVYWEFAPLTVMSETEAATVEDKEADTLTKLVNSGLFQDAALEESFSQRMVDSGRWPGYEKARKTALAEAAANPTPEDVTGVANPPAPGAAGAGGSGTGTGNASPAGGPANAAG